MKRPTPKSRRMEEWRDIPGYEGLYQASSTGRVRSLDRNVVRETQGTYVVPGRVLSTNCNGVGGRWKLVLTKGKKKANFYVHRLVAAAFLGPCPDGLEVNHIDHNCKNNNIENLEYVTKSYNTKHSWTNPNRKHSPRYGENCGRSKLKDADVRHIKEYVRAGGTQKAMREKFGICSSTVSQIVSGKRWPHIK